ncbi:hypothetical protein FOA52_013122 [Chlamydomonas sp. UWO 241]|nr:hypothetical protein FOA52_013122 [Chlamydomonas sp. UWO 241]
MPPTMPPASHGRVFLLTPPPPWGVPLSRRDLKNPVLAQSNAEKRASIAACGSVSLLREMEQRSFN